MRKQCYLMTVALIAVLLAGASLAWAVPYRCNYQGMLTDDVGNPLAGIYDIRFQLCAALSGPCLWSEDQAVTVADGVYNVQLGETNPLNPSFLATTLCCIWKSASSMPAPAVGRR